MRTLPQVVQGAAVARQAARNLERKTGMPATSVAALLHGRVEIPQLGVLVIDEAGMLPTRDLHQLVLGALERETKVVLVGDDRQLPEIEAGGAFAALARRLPAIELTEDRRQRGASRRDLLEQLREGETRRVLTALQDTGDLQFAPTSDAAIDVVVAQYVDALSRGEDSLMRAVCRREVDSLNTRARVTLARRGELGPGTFVIGELELARADLVLLRVNDDRLDVQNGTRGVVMGLDPVRHSVEIATTDDRRVRLDGRYLDRRAADGGAALAYGYAATGHAAQGATVDSAFVLGSDAIYREWLYVALTRSRDRTTLVVPDEALARGVRTRVTVDRLAELASRSQRQTMALELAEPSGVAALLSQEIGARPADTPGALRWDRALKAVDAYRGLDQYPSGDDTLLGPRPAERGARSCWISATRAVERAHARQRDLGRDL